jgi:DNA-binding transcriptional MerR regulator
MRRIVGKTTYLSPREVAQSLGVNTRTVQRWVSSRNKSPKKRKVKLSFITDPINGYRYFEEKEVNRLVLALKKKTSV